MNDDALVFIEKSVRRAARENDNFPPKKGDSEDEIHSWCRHQLTTTLHHLIEIEISKVNDSESLSNDDIVKRVLQSEEYKAAHGKNRLIMTRCLSELGQKYQKKQDLSSELTSLPSSSISSRSMFYTRDQLEELFRQMESKPHDTIIKLLKLCGDNSIEELFQEELEIGVLMALNDDNSHKNALLFLTKIMCHGNQNEIQRAHHALFQYLIEQIEMENVIKYATVLRVLNEIYIDITLVWGRFMEDRIETIVDEAISILSVKTYYSIFAELDPQAVWLKSWTHCSNSRKALKKSFQKHPQFVFHGEVNFIYFILCR